MSFELEKFSKVIFKQYNFVRNTDVLLETRFPILFAFQADREMYLAYIVKLKKRTKIIDLVVSKTTTEILLNIVTQKLSINDALELFGKENIERISYQGDEELTEDNIVPYDQIFKEEVYLDLIMPNKIDLEVLKNKLLLLMKIKNIQKNLFIEKQNQNKFSFIEMKIESKEKPIFELKNYKEEFREELTKESSYIIKDKKMMYKNFKCSFEKKYYYGEKKYEFQPYI